MNILAPKMGPLKKDPKPQKWNSLENGWNDFTKFEKNLWRPPPQIKVQQMQHPHDYNMRITGAKPKCQFSRKQPEQTLVKFLTPMAHLQRRKEASDFNLCNEV
jgi:hypothetical protein